jgi:DNA polymerase III delta prime subunit
MSINSNSSLAEVYRGKNVASVILPTAIKSMLTSLASSGMPQNLTLTSEKAGTGKTTMARALAKAWNCPNPLFINMSHEGKAASIPDIIAYADIEDITGENKIIIFDEANAAKSIPFQEPLKGILEQYDGQMTCILTSNGTNNIIDPLLSRCRPIYFDFNSQDYEEMLPQIYSRLGAICMKEGVIFDEESMTRFISDRFPDIRSMILDIQIIKNSGNTIATYTEAVGMDPFIALPSLITSGDWEQCRRLVCDNIRSVDRIYRSLYDNLLGGLEPHTAMGACLVINKHEHMASTKIDKELNAAAMLASLIQGIYKR